MPTTLTSSPAEAPNQESALKNPVSPSQSGILGKKDVLQNLLEARKDMSNIDSAAVSALNPKWKAGKETQQRVVKDYILSTEPYKIKSGL
jgi:hypothetical protein